MLMAEPKQENKKIIWIFAAASFLNDMGSDIIYPVWPLFVTTVINANMAVLGFLDGLGEALVSISQAAAGYFSDKYKKRKIFIWIGYFMGSLSRIGYSLSTVWLHLIPFRILDRGGKIRSAPRDAMVADVSTDRNRGRHFGILRSMDHMGAVCGILICIVLIERIGLRVLFALAALPSLASVILILLFIKEKRPDSSRIFKGFTFRDMNRPLSLFFLLSTLYGLGAFSYSFLLIYARRSGYRLTFIPVLFLIFTAAASLFSFLFGHLSDKIGRKSVIGISFLGWMMLCILIITVRGKWILYAVFFLYGLHRGALEPVQRAYVCELAPQRVRASCLGGYQMVMGLTAFPASFMAGILWDQIHIFAPFFLSLVLTGLAGILLIFVQPGRPNT